MIINIMDFIESSRQGPPRRTEFNVMSDNHPYFIAG
jgi:hypothetical protein